MTLAYHCLLKEGAVKKGLVLAMAGMVLATAHSGCYASRMAIKRIPVPSVEQMLGAPVSNQPQRSIYIRNVSYRIVGEGTLLGESGERVNCTSLPSQVSDAAKEACAIYLQGEIPPEAPPARRLLDPCTYLDATDPLKTVMVLAENGAGVLKNGDFYLFKKGGGELEEEPNRRCLPLRTEQK